MDDVPEFGVTPYSVGFRCSDGTIIYHDGTKTQTQETSVKPQNSLSLSGDCISIIIEGTEVGSQVRISRNSNEIGCIALDKVLPTTLKPMVAICNPKGNPTEEYSSSQSNRYTIAASIKQAVTHAVEAVADAVDDVADAVLHSSHAESSEPTVTSVKL